jgi:hypothetical protein
MMGDRSLSRTRIDTGYVDILEYRRTEPWMDEVAMVFRNCPALLLDFTAVRTIPIEKISNHVASWPCHHTIELCYTFIYFMLCGGMSILKLLRTTVVPSLSLTAPLH